jgi:hypothetical protein
MWINTTEKPTAEIFTPLHSLTLVIINAKRTKLKAGAVEELYGFVHDDITNVNRLKDSQRLALRRRSHAH